MMMMCTIRRGEERAVGQRQILCRVVVVIRIIRAGRTRKTAVLIQKISQSVLFSSKERREREREREKEKREESAPSNYTLSSQESASFSCHRAYNNRQKKELLLLLLLTWLGQFTTRKDNAPRGGKPKVVIFFLVGKGGGASMMRV